MNASVMFAVSRRWRPKFLSRFSWVSPDSIYTILPGRALQGPVDAAASPIFVSEASSRSATASLKGDGASPVRLTSELGAPASAFGAPASGEGTPLLVE